MVIYVHDENASAESAISIVVNLVFIVLDKFTVYYHYLRTPLPEELPELLRLTPEEVLEADPAEEAEVLTVPRDTVPELLTRVLAVVVALLRAGTDAVPVLRTGAVAVVLPDEEDVVRDDTEVAVQREDVVWPAVLPLRTVVDTVPFVPPLRTGAAAVPLALPLLTGADVVVVLCEDTEAAVLREGDAVAAVEVLPPREDVAVTPLAFPLRTGAAVVELVLPLRTADEVAEFPLRTVVPETVPDCDAVRDADAADMARAFAVRISFAFASRPRDAASALSKAESAPALLAYLSLNERSGYFCP